MTGSHSSPLGSLDGVKHLLTEQPTWTVKEISIKHRTRDATRQTGTKNLGCIIFCILEVFYSIFYPHHSLVISFTCSAQHHSGSIFHWFCRNNLENIQSHFFYIWSPHTESILKWFWSKVKNKLISLSLHGNQGCFGDTSILFTYPFQCAQIVSL